MESLGGPQVLKKYSWSPRGVLMDFVWTMVNVGESCLIECNIFSSRSRHTRYQCDWSSDVCSSDLVPHDRIGGFGAHAAAPPWAGASELSHQPYRSEERRVGKECRSRWSPDH